MTVADWFEFLKMMGAVLGLGWVLMLVAAWMLDDGGK